MLVVARTSRYTWVPAAALVLLPLLPAAGAWALRLGASGHLRALGEERRFWGVFFVLALKARVVSVVAKSSRGAVLGGALSFVARFEAQ